MKLYRVLAILIVFLLPELLFAQKDFDYRRKLTGIKNPDWYSVTILPESFSKLNRDFSDIRIYSFAGNDTSEVPHLIKIMADDTREQSYSLPVLNKSRKDGALFLTFQLDPDQKVNSIDLNFQQENFFALVTLQGSNNQTDWFDIIENQRLVSIRNPNTNFKVQSVSFPLSQYRFIRATVSSDTKLTFLNATLRNSQVTKGNYIPSPLSFRAREERKQKQTIVDVKLKDYVPVSHFEIDVEATTDFYRSFQLEYVVDSTTTPKGWIKNYHPFYNGYLTSFTPNVFDVTYDLTKEIRLVINNLDNEPLPIKGIRVAGPEVKVIAKLDRNDSYLYYGNSKALKPSYDLDYFQEKIPANVLVARAADEENVSVQLASQSPLFENELWLWVVMVIVIAVLGFFTLRMMKARPQSA